MDAGGIIIVGKRVRQGVRVETAQGKCLCDGRGYDFMWISLLLAFIVLMLVMLLIVPANSQRLIGLVYLIGIFWVAYVLWFLLKKLRSYSFLAKDGLYIVRHGWAVRIPWKKIENVEAVNLVGPRSSYSFYRFRFKPDLTDEITGTPIQLNKKRDYHFPAGRKAIRILIEHAKMI